MLVECEVTANRLMIEVFETNGRPKTVEKTDMFGNKFIETVEKIYVKGDKINIPEAKADKLKKSVKRTQVTIKNIKKPKNNADTEIKEKPKTVGELIPKD